MTKSWLEHQCFQWSFTNRMTDHLHLCILGLVLFGLGVSEDAIDVVSHCSQVENSKRKLDQTKETKSSVFPLYPTSKFPSQFLSLSTSSLRNPSLTNFFKHHLVTIDYAAGPTVDSPDDPFVLVGAAHCNHICKDRLTGDVLETCCCRPVGTPGSCKKVALKLLFLSAL